MIMPFLFERQRCCRFWAPRERANRIRHAMIPAGKPGLISDNESRWALRDGRIKILIRQADEPRKKVDASFPGYGTEKWDDFGIVADPRTCEPLKADDFWGHRRLPAHPMYLAQPDCKRAQKASDMTYLGMRWGRRAERLRRNCRHQV